MTRTMNPSPHLWIYSGRRGTTMRFHLSANRFEQKHWSLPPVGYGLCGTLISLYETTVEPPPHLEMCDDCALVDFLEPSVYRFWDAGDVLLYIGCSDNVLQRFYQHGLKSSASRVWWPRRVRVSITTYATTAEAFAAETLAIDTEKPLYPRPRKWSLLDAAELEVAA